MVQQAKKRKEIKKMAKTKHDVDLKGRVGYGLCNTGVNIIQVIVGSPLLRCTTRII